MDITTRLQKVKNSDIFFFVFLLAGSCLTTFKNPILFVLGAIVWFIRAGMLLKKSFANVDDISKNHEEKAPKVKIEWIYIVIALFLISFVIFSFISRKHLLGW